MNELETKLAELKAELADLDEKLSQVEAWKKRRDALLPSYWGRGEIKAVERQIYMEQFPVFKEEPDFGGTKRKIRIVEVTDKWVYLQAAEWKDDFREQYNRKTGMEGNARRWGKRIDIAKALSIWEEHQRQQEPATV